MVDGKKKRGKRPEKFLFKEEIENIINAIKEVERESTTEIRVHITPKVKGDILEEAKKTFFKIGMDKTKGKTGILFFFAIKNREFAIIGDEEINNKAGKEFWKETAIKMEEFFKKDKFGEGIVFGIYEIGDILKKYFPYKNDTNELPDELSFG
ncbi:MAG: TPM domain-containing protein [Chitinispirillaceae bacterium]|nr:TPM domain-containing protein [Chitinispirillaceae bacterium]